MHPSVPSIPTHPTKPNQLSSHDDSDSPTPSPQPHPHRRRPLLPATSSPRRPWQGDQKQVSRRRPWRLSSSPHVRSDQTRSTRGRSTPTATLRRRGRARGPLLSSGGAAVAPTHLLQLKAAARSLPTRSIHPSSRVGPRRRSRPSGMTRPCVRRWAEGLAPPGHRRRGRLSPQADGDAALPCSDPSSIKTQMQAGRTSFLSSSLLLAAPALTTDLCCSCSSRQAGRRTPNIQHHRPTLPSHTETGRGRERERGAAAGHEFGQPTVAPLRAPARHSHSHSLRHYEVAYIPSCREGQRDHLDGDRHE